jgi:hypothetical protein
MSIATRIGAEVPADSAADSIRSRWSVESTITAGAVSGSAAVRRASAVSHSRSALG